MKSKIYLTPEHRKKRVNWVIERIDKRMDWFIVIFSDEKQFNLDDPDGYKCNRHNVNKEERSFTRRPKCQKGVMVRGAISFSEKLKLAIIPGTLGSEGYVSTVEKDLPEFITEHSDKNLVFMQDNAAVHTSRRSVEWFREKGIEVLPWPAKSPDLNPIENVWYLLSRKVYGGGTQYYSVEELTKAILKAWDEITEEVVIGLYNTMSRRLSKVFAGKGEITN